MLSLVTSCTDSPKQIQLLSSRVLVVCVICYPAPSFICRLRYANSSMAFAPLLQVLHLSTNPLIYKSKLLRRHDSLLNFYPLSYHPPTKNFTSSWKSTSSLHTFPLRHLPNLYLTILLLTLLIPPWRRRNNNSNN